MSNDLYVKVASVQRCKEWVCSWPAFPYFSTILHLCLLGILLLDPFQKFLSLPSTSNFVRISGRLSRSADPERIASEKTNLILFRHMTRIRFKPVKHSSSMWKPMSQQGTRGSPPPKQMHINCRQFLITDSDQSLINHHSCTANPVLKVHRL